MITSGANASDKQTAIPEAFERIARKYPGRHAVVSATGAITYAELADESRRVARHLVAIGVRPGDIVPVVARRSTELASAILGVLFTGAAYGILDVRWPGSRVTRFVDAMASPVVLADEAGADLLAATGTGYLTFEELRAKAADVPVIALPRVEPQDCATVFWTSGSTGAPKAVLSPHRATTRLFTPTGFMDFGDAPVMIHAAAVAWDAFTLELWGMLLTGGTVLVHSGDLLLPHEIRAYIRDFGATHLFLTPSLFDAIATGDLGCFTGLRALLLGGDKPSPVNCRKLLAAHPDIELYNGYGPVESCVFATTHRITEADTRTPTGIPAGFSVPNTGLHIIQDGLPVTRGETGEVAISGTGLALGYLNEPEQTAAAFRTVRIDGAEQRVYLTGDHGWMDESGLLHFAGRRDSQLKIAGHRIEPSEIEAAAGQLGSRRSIVLPIPDRSGAPRLVLFTERPEPALAEQEMRRGLQQLLPAYMVPSRIHFLSSIPLLENTKIDKRGLLARFGYSA